MTMIAKLAFLLFALTGALPCALEAQVPKTYDPGRDTLVRLSKGVWQIAVAQSTLIASVCATTPELAQVADVRVGLIRDAPYLIFRGRHALQPERALYVAVALREGAPGSWLAGAGTQTCSGNPCHACTFASGGCSCESFYDPDRPLETGSCNHSISTRLALAPVSAAKD